MNLWAKSVGQLLILAVALFFFSCEDESSILGFKNPNPKFKVYYVEIPLETSSQLIDSVITDNKGLTQAGAMLGSYTDAEVGSITAQPYLQIIPGLAAAIPVTAKLDSVTMGVRLSFYSYGFTGETTVPFDVMELNESMDRTRTTRYYSNSSIPYHAGAVGHGSFTVSYDSLVKQLKLDDPKRDTIVAHIRLSDEFAQRLFNVATGYSFVDVEGTTANEYLDNIQVFLREIPGFTLVSNDKNGLLGLDILDNFSHVTLHYHTVTSSGATDQTLVRNYPFGLTSFTNITADRSTSPFAGLSSYQSQADASTTGLRYTQSGSGIITRIDLKNFYAFADTLSTIIVNEAVLEIGGVQTSFETLPPHSRLTLQAMKENNQFLNYAVKPDTTIYLPYTRSATLLKEAEGNHFVVRSDNTSSASGMALDLIEDKYGSYATTFTQDLFRLKTSQGQLRENRLKYLAITPVIPPLASGVNRTIFNAGDVRLKIYYTKPTLNTTP